MEKTEPTLSNVVNSMYNQVRAVITTENVQTATLGTIAVTYYLSKGFVKTFSKTISIPFALPTYVRKAHNFLKTGKDFESDNEIENLGKAFGVAIGVVGWLATPLIGTEYLGDKYGYISMGTNTLSGLYEWYRHTKNKMAGQNVENQIIVEPNNKLEIAPPQEVTPEDEKARGLIVKSALKLEELAKELKQS